MVVKSHNISLIWDAKFCFFSMILAEIIWAIRDGVYMCFTWQNEKFRQYNFDLFTFLLYKPLEFDIQNKWFWKVSVFRIWDTKFCFFFLSMIFKSSWQSLKMQLIFVIGPCPCWVMACCLWCHLSLMSSVFDVTCLWCHLSQRSLTPSCQFPVKESIKNLGWDRKVQNQIYYT